MAFQLGQVIKGRYRILSSIGQGRMGSIFIAEDQRMSKQVKFETFPSDGERQRLQNFEVLLELNHPNIFRTLDFGIESDTLYLVTNYPSATKIFYEVHRRGSILPFDLVSSYTKQIANALDYIHAKGIVHRDVKPANMFVQERSEIWLGNFGVAIYDIGVHQKNIIDISDIIGTPAYMAPEQFEGTVGPTSDQYSLAVVVYEWLSGKLPFTGSTTDIIIQHMRAVVPLLRSVAPSVPMEVETIIHKALAKNPRDRFSSVSEFAENLERAFRYGAVPGQQTFNNRSPSYGSTSPAPPPAIRSTDPYSEGSWSGTQTLPPSPPAYPGQGNPYGAEPIGPTQKAPREKEPTEQPQGTELSLFAIARTKLEDDDRAIIGNIYTVEVGISQQRPDDFYGQRFRIHVQNPTAPLPFDILLHVSENVILLGSWYQRLTYNPRSLQPQLLSCSFRLRTPGKSYILVNFYRERQWLKTIRFEFESIEKPVLSSSHKS